MTEQNNILHNEGELTEEQLLQYLAGTLPAEERFAVEKKMADSSFVNDAVEGLESFSDKKDIKQYVAELNRQLHKQTSNKIKRKNKRSLKSMDWILVAVVTVILLCVLGYVVIHMYQKH